MSTPLLIPLVSIAVLAVIILTPLLAAAVRHEEGTRMERGLRAYDELPPARRPTAEGRAAA